jgi:hypothetical protein
VSRLVRYTTYTYDAGTGLLAVTDPGPSPRGSRGHD